MRKEEVAVVPALGVAGLVGAGAAALYLLARRRREAARRGQRAWVDVLLNTLTAGDAATERHSRRVAGLTDVLADALRLGEKQRATLRLAALLHDLGKIDDRYFAIVHGERPLDEGERRRIEDHPSTSAYILGPLEEIHPGLVEIVSAHHESWNGEGYPRGLRGEEIPLGARLIAVADFFDALTQHRSYRSPRDPEEVLREIAGEAGGRFDPAVVALLGRPWVRARWLAGASRGRRSEAAEGADADQRAAASRPTR
jgi:putative nucleotidyltransferase with HDIG domain